MSNIPNTPSLSDFMDKSFWSRTEGTWGKVVLGILGVGAAAGAVMFLPAILTWIAFVLATTLRIVVTGGILFAIGYALSDPNFRNLLGYTYRASVRWLTGFIVDLSPRAVLEDYVAELKKSLGRLVGQIKNLGAQITSLTRTIEQNNQLKEQSLKLASQAKKQGKERDVVLAGRKAGRLSNSNMTLSQLQTKLEVIYRVLMKMKEACEFSIADTESAVDTAIREHTALQAGARAMKEALEIINGDPQKKAMFDMAMERLATDAAQYASEMAYAMEVSENFLSSVDLQNGVFDEEALKMLETWEKQVDSKILGPGVKQDILNAAYNPANVLDAEVVVEEAPQRRRVGGGSRYFEN